MAGFAADDFSAGDYGKPSDLLKGENVGIMIYDTPGMLDIFQEATYKNYKIALLTKQDCGSLSPKMVIAKWAMYSGLETMPPCFLPKC